MKIKSLLVLLILMIQSGWAQLDKANKKFAAYDYQEAIVLYEKYLEKQADSEEARLKLAEAYKISNQSSKSIEHLKYLVDNVDAKELYVLKLVDQLRVENRIHEAKTYTQKLQQNFGNQKYSHLMKTINLYDTFSKSKAEYQTKFLFGQLESSIFAPTLYDNSTLIVTKESKGTAENALTGRHSTNLELVPIYGSDFKSFAKAVMSNQNDGVGSLSQDKTELYFNTVYSKGKTEAGFETKKLKIVHARNIEDNWTKVDDFPWNDPSFNTAHPHLSDDGMMLFFSSDRPGGSGGMDIYYSKRQSGSWSTPVNVSAINTDQNELFPVLNGNELYFSSNGHAGLGGLDLFSSTMNGTSFSDAQNLHAPFNSTYDDFHILKTEKEFYVSTNRNNNHTVDNIMVITEAKPEPVLEEVVEIIEETPEEHVIRVTVQDKYTKTPLPYASVVFKDSDGQLVYKGLTDEEGRVEIDHLEADNYKVLGELNNVSTTIAKINKKDFSEALISKIITHNDPRFTLKGIVTNSKTGEPIEKVEVLRDNISFNLKSTNETLEDGVFFFQLEQKSDYKISAKKSKWLASEVAYETTKGLDRSKQLYVELQLNLQQPEKNAVIQLKNIFYDLNKCDIKPKAAEELDRLVKLMKDYPDMTIELSSHTDSRGSDAYNLKLSQCRAESASSYLVSKGIDKSRLKGVGYGETKLTNTCSNGVECSEAQHQANRRTEFKILNCVSCP
ncbi:MAG: OmpA family protein [Flavobacteriales bacterium]